jgi:hypothetical protein
LHSKPEGDERKQSIIRKNYVNMFCVKDKILIPYESTLSFWETNFVSDFKNLTIEKKEQNISW